MRCITPRLVFEGERAYNGKIFESREAFRTAAGLGADDRFEIPWTVDEIEAAKYEVMKANGLTDAYVRAVAWRGSGEDMGVASAEPGPAGHRGLGMGQPITATPR
jgi:branched-chain amino acid aminotransferase